MKKCKSYLEPAQELIHTFLDEQYNSIPTNPNQDQYVQQRFVFEKERYKAYLVREEQKDQESIKNTLFRHLEVRPKETPFISKKSKRNEKIIHQNRLHL